MVAKFCDGGKRITGNKREDTGYGHFQRLVKKKVEDPVRAWFDALGIPCPIVIKLKEILPQKKRGTSVTERRNRNQWNF